MAHRCRRPPAIPPPPSYSKHDGAVASRRAFLLNIRLHSFSMSSIHSNG